VPLVAVALVIVAGLLHASWNFVAKKAGGDLRFAALSSVFMVAVWAPLGVSLAVREVPQWGAGPWLCVLGSALCHVPYFVLLLRGYRVADLTVVYPVARGSGPLITAAVAITAFGEPATLATGLGVLCITAGIALVAGQPQAASTEDRARVWRGLRYGLGTGAAIAGYTLVDGFAVKHLLVPPLLVVFMSDTCRTLLLLPLLLRDRTATRALFRQQWRHALAVALLGPRGLHPGAHGGADGAALARGAGAGDLDALRRAARRAPARRGPPRRASGRRGMYGRRGDRAGLGVSGRFRPPCGRRASTGR
jgi:drug/metabolite transporter (DMT)-like permease